MKSATKKLSTEIAESLTGKIDAISAGSKTIKKSIEKAAAKLAKKVVKFEKETLKKTAKEAKNAEKKQDTKSKEKKHGKKSKAERAEKVAALVADASSKVTVAAPVKANIAKTGAPKTSTSKSPSNPIGGRSAVSEQQQSDPVSSE